MGGLELSGVGKRFGRAAVLNGLDLSVEAGSVTALLGPSGVGKTTLLRLIVGFEEPDAGTITLGARPLFGPGLRIAPERRRIGYMPQEGSLFPHLTVAQNITFGLPRARRRAAVAPLVELVGLGGLERRYPHQLSGGQQQRVALARALAVKPELVALDEPFAALDAQLRAEVGGDVIRILKAAGTTTVLVTHNQEEALSIADRVAVLRDGRVVQHGSARELYNEPVDARVAQSIGEANLSVSTLRGGHVETPLGRLPAVGFDSSPALSEGSTVQVMVRPEQIALVSAGKQGAVRGQVVSCNFKGHDALLEVTVGAGDRRADVLVRAFVPDPYQPGEECWLNVAGPVRVWPV